MNDKKIKKLLNKYTYIIEELKKNKVIKTTKVVGDYGEHIASKKLKLKLVGSSNNKGYDAGDTKENKYEIKTRKASSSNIPTVFQVNLNQLSVINFLIYVEFDNKWNLVNLLKIPVKEIRVRANRHKRVCVTKDLIKRFSVL